MRSIAMGLALLAAAALVLVATTAGVVVATPAPAPYYPPPPGEVITIVAFWMINPATGKWLHPLNATSTIHLAEGPIAIGAVVGPASASADGGAALMAAAPADPDEPTYAVVWTTPRQWAHTDEAPPYLLAGDYRGRVRTVDIYPGTLRLGAYVNTGGGDPSQRERVLNVRVL